MLTIQRPEICNKMKYIAGFLKMLLTLWDFQTEIITDRDIPNKLTQKVFKKVFYKKWSWDVWSQDISVQCNINCAVFYTKISGEEKLYNSKLYFKTVYVSTLQYML